MVNPFYVRQVLNNPKYNKTEDMGDWYLDEDEEEDEEPETICYLCGRKLIKGDCPYCDN